MRINNFNAFYNVYACAFIYSSVHISYKETCLCIACISYVPFYVKMHRNYYSINIDPELNTKQSLQWFRQCSTILISSGEVGSTVNDPDSTENLVNRAIVNIAVTDSVTFILLK